MSNQPPKSFSRAGIVAMAAGSLLATALVTAPPSTAAKSPPTITVTTTVSPYEGIPSTARSNTPVIVSFAVKNTAAKDDELLAGFSIVVPTGATAVTVGTVTAPSGKTWTGVVQPCGTTPACAKIIRVSSMRTTKSNYLARGQTLTVKVNLTTPNRTGSLRFAFTGINPTDFKVAGVAPAITLVNPSTPPAFTVASPSPTPVLTNSPETVQVTSSPAFIGTSVTVKVNTADVGAVINGTMVNASGTATVPVTPSGGAFTLTAVFTKAQSQALTVTSGTSTGSSASFTVSSSSLDVSVPGPVVASRIPRTVTVTNSTFTGGPVTVTYATADGGATVNGVAPDPVTRSVTFTTGAVGGSFTFDAAFTKAGPQSLTVSSGRFSGTSPALAVAAGTPFLSLRPAVDIPVLPETTPLSAIAVNKAFSVPFDITDAFGNPYVGVTPTLMTFDPALAAHLTVSGTTATGATGHGSFTASYDQAQQQLLLQGDYLGSQSSQYVDIIDVGVSVALQGQATVPLQITNLDLGLGGATASINLPNGAFGPVSVYVAPVDCAAAAGSGLPCDSTTKALTVDLVATAPSDAPTPDVHLYTNDAPATVSTTCIAAACPEPTPSPSSSPGAPQAGQVASGSQHGCAVQIDATVGCWGENTSGQVDPASTTSPVIPPVTVSGVAGATAVAGGNPDASNASTDNGQHTCAVEGQDGSVWCWGDNNHGQLGQGVLATSYSTPVQVLTGVNTFLQGVSQIAAGAAHTCAVKLSDGSVWCWGSNSSGQLGPDQLTLGATESAFAVPVADDTGPLLGVSAIAAGARHTCAIRQSDGTVWCWGDNGNDQAGSASQPITLLAPVGSPGSPSTPLTGVSVLTAGLTHTCAAHGTNEVDCWGDNSHQQLGVDNTVVPNATYVPVASYVPIDGSVYSLAAGGAHTCAVGGSAFVYCWGDNTLGQSGPSNVGSSAVPRQSVNLNNAYVIEVSAAAQHTCVRLLDWSVQCWGDNSHGAVGTPIGVGPSHVEPPTVVDGLITIPPPAQVSKLDEYTAYPLWLALKKFGSYQPYEQAPTCRDMVANPLETGVGKLVTPEAQLAGFCVDVAAIVRDGNGALTLPVLFVEDPKLAPVR